ncbi:MAG TPA: tetratricopeptide repeat protein, partial [Burkholderiales bacterium]|nr:tetratricopeptide repeat protein [Burkholderiales bacterium]
MSLLLEALKKAEKAKEEAQRRARGESGDAEPAAAAQAAPGGAAQLALEGEPAPDEATRHVTTRAELPDISAPLDIEREDLGPKAQPREALRLESQKAPPRRPGVQPASQAAAPQDAERATARKVFEAKFREPNPKLPFYITLASLSVFAIGVVVYFWYQLRPPYPLVNSNPVRSTAEAQVAAAPLASAPPAASSAASASSAIPGLPSSPPAPPIQPATRAPSAPPVERPLLSPAPRLAAPSINSPAGTPVRPLPEVSVTRAPVQVHPKVDAGYAAYQAGDLAKARGEYEQALADEPGNRDALLGLAAVDTRSGRYEA